MAVPLQSLAVQLACQLPDRVLQRLPEDTQARDLIYALETQIRMISFDPALPVTVVASADGGHVFALQGALSDPTALRASVCIEQLRPMVQPAWKPAQKP